MAASLFRDERLLGTDAWEVHYRKAREKFELLFKQCGALNTAQMNSANMAKAYDLDLGDALRYLAGPPISDDDLKTIADVRSLSKKARKDNPEAIDKVLSVIQRVIDPHRFPWVVNNTKASPEQLEAALLASAVLLAAQRVATGRRMDGKEVQEEKVKTYLRSLGFDEVAPATISTLVGGPQAMQFCAECQLGERKADVVIRLHDTRLMALECKVSNSATNSVKRLNNDAAVKAEYWLKAFGTAQVVPAAVLAGVFKVKNLEQAQESGLALLWSHDLPQLGNFIESTR